MSKLTTPVAFIIFNRPDTTKQVFECIRKAQPEKLYIISDAPREGRQDDIVKVAETREYVESHIDWDCQVFMNYAKENMGCKMRVASGISWVLENEESTIILEDDIVPVPSFFTFLQDMLEHYKDNPRVMMVSGVNLIDHDIENQYTFSCFSGIWGWGTWRRAWQHYDVDIKDWPRIKRTREFTKVQNGLAYMFLKKHMDSVYNHEKDTWDYQWDFARFKRRGLGVVPKYNMITNIGFGADATHTTEESDQVFETHEMEFPIDFNVPVKRDVAYDRKYIRKNFGVGSAFKAVARKLKKK